MVDAAAAVGAGVVTGQVGFEGSGLVVAAGGAGVATVNVGFL